MPGAAYVTVIPLDQILGQERRAFALGATMFTVFGGLALLLAAVGLYSVISYGVLQRRHELGVRVALGARVGDILGMVVGEGMRLATVAVALGLLVAWAAGRWMAPLLFETSPHDVPIFGGVAVVLLLIALVASVIPARRAAQVDPNVALRAD
jgi:ABC-type antimicrobial peptide transport system permease subunit